MKRIIRVGIVQQSCTNDLKTNLEKLHRNIASVAQAGAQLSCYRSYIIPLIFARRKILPCSIWQNLFPVHRQDSTVI